jgi:hypothetical protein
MNYTPSLENWNKVKNSFAEKAASFYEHKLIPLRVMVSISTVKDGSEWYHLSVSRPNRLPTWQELMKAKLEFLGPHVEAYQVLPAESDYVNLHPNCLHLWSPVDGKRRVANLYDLVNERAP